MASKTRTAIGLWLSMGLVTAALVAALAGLWIADPEPAGLNGFGAVAMAPLAGLFLLTLAAYALAFVVPQNRLALIQAVAMIAYGVAMALLGVALLASGIATFVGLVSLALAFPFGTIVYFANFGCGAGDLDGWAALSNALLSGHCFAGAQAMALLALVLKALALAVLLIAAAGFAKVKGLWWLLAWGTAFGGLIALAFWKLSGLPFVLYPVDAAITALLGLVLAIYGLVVVVKSLLAGALALAGQLG